MLTQEENDFLTRVGPGTPAGKLLRRYWFPIAPMRDLTPEQPTQFIRLLGEDLVLFRDKSGRVGLLGDHCSHRGASLLYGRVEERGLACAYHGWLYDVDGKCLETPAEPADSKFRLTVKHTAYRVRPFIGMYWAYLGPDPAPEITKYDVWAAPGGTRRVVVQPLLPCNWFQIMENSADPAHAHILHQEAMAGWGRPKPESTTRGYNERVAGFDFYEIPFGLMKRRIYKDGINDEHPLLFPNALREGNATQIRVPIDDTHTQEYFVRFEPADDPTFVEPNEDVRIEYAGPYKDPPDAPYPAGKYDMSINVQAGDYMAWETQGPISDRTRERLATADRGVEMFRDMVRREIERMKRGLDPMSVVRDPDHPIVDTNLQETLKERALWVRPHYNPELHKAWMEEEAAKGATRS